MWDYSQLPTAQTKDSRSEEIRISVTEGVRSDTNEQRVVVSDIMNMVLTPDASALTNRGGSEYRLKTGTLNVPTGMVAIRKETDPPDIPINMFLVIDGTAVTNISFMRDRTQIEGESITEVIGILPEAPIETDVPEDTIGDSPFLGTATFFRTGNIANATTVTLRVLNTDYPDATVEELSTWMAANPMTFEAFEPSKDWDFKLHFVELLKPPAGEFYFQIGFTATNDAAIDPAHDTITLKITVT